MWDVVRQNWHRTVLEAKEDRAKHKLTKGWPMKRRLQTASWAATGNKDTTKQERDDGLKRNHWKADQPKDGVARLLTKEWPEDNTRKDSSQTETSNQRQLMVKKRPTNNGQLILPPTFLLLFPQSPFFFKVYYHKYQLTCLKLNSEVYILNRLKVDFKNIK